MKLLTILFRVQKYLKFDDAFSVEDLLDNINESINEIHNLLSAYSNSYYIKSAEYELTKTFEQKFKIPEDYSLFESVQYIECSRLCIMNKGDISDIPGAKEEMYKILNSDIIFYNIQASKKIKLLYYPKPCAINIDNFMKEYNQSVSNELSENAEKYITINIPSYLEELFVLSILKKCRIQDSENKNEIDKEYEFNCGIFINNNKKEKSKITKKYSNMNFYY